MSLPYQALGAAFRAADKTVPKSWLPRTDTATLIAASGANPDAGAREGLARLIAAIERDSELSFFGKLSLRWDMIRLLRNAQRVEGAHRANPSLGATEVAAPIFILGLPRSGTTFLHGLMAEDATNLVPRNWQTIYPAPRPPGFNAASDSRARKVDAQLKIFGGLAPGFEQMHPITADSPQECSEITAHVFQSLRFDTTFRVPGYLAWLEARGHTDAFRFHRKFLQVLQNGVASRWVLKCPDHTFSLDAILQVYPDARFVIVHRDPIAVLGSVAHLTGVLRKPFLKNIDPAEIGTQVAERWIEGANILLAFDQREDVPGTQKIHVHYDELTAAPLAVIERIYAGFGLPFGPEAIEAITRVAAVRPQGGYGQHGPYSLDAFEISAQTIQARFAPYIRRYCRDQNSSRLA